MKTINKLKVVLDTNVVLVSIPEYSKNHWLYQSLVKNKFDLYVTTEILYEYEEKIAEKLSEDTATFFGNTLMELDNVIHTIIYYKLQLITADQDDNKFVDCAFASNVNYLVTNDKHFNVLKTLVFPRINIINIDEFKKIIVNYQ